MEPAAKILTTEIVESLDNQGYIYFLSKPGIEEVDSITIPILPIKYNPEDKPLPHGYDGWFSIREQGYEMGRGIDAVSFVIIEPDGKHTI